MCTIKTMGSKKPINMNNIIRHMDKIILKGEQVLSFIPPDGRFRLFSYRVATQQ